MKPYVISLAVGSLVGGLYGLLGVRSPAPPAIALIGLLGMLIGEQAASFASCRIRGDDTVETAAPPTTERNAL